MAARLAISSVSKPRRGQGLAAAAADISPGPLVVALALPLLFLHARFQPTLTFSLGSTRPQAMLSDFAVLAVAAAALVTGIRRGFAPLRAGWWIWAAGAFFLIWIGISIVSGSSRFDSYPAGTHFVTAVKWDEYALLALSLPLLLRRVRDLELVLAALGIWSLAATVVGVLEFFGADVASTGTFGRRQASFLGSSDFAALSGAALLAGVVVLVLPGARLDRRLGRLLVGSGALGSIIAGSLSALLGLATALVLFGVVLFVRAPATRRRLAVVAAVLGVVGVASLAIRSADLNAFSRFLGGKQADTSNPNKVQTYAHRTLLAYIGVRIWEDHPLLGVGWEGSNDPYAYMPYVPDAKKRYPDESPLAFPTPTRSYGVQNVYLQALADMGIVGLVAWLAPFAAALALGLRSARREAGAIACLWLVFVLWCWTAQGFVAGIPLDALTWLAVGLAATAAAWRRTGA